jgi:oligo-1,6-glucosidase
VNDFRAGWRSTGDPSWWRDAVVYQVYPRSFADSDGDGIGDLRGLLGRVDYLHELGIDVVWLSPIYASPHDDNGYDISDYRAIDPAFGTLEDLDEVIAALHERGMRLVMDLVVNHTSDEHPWFVESASSPQSAKRDWYWWRPPRDGFAAGEPGAEPTNWGSFFSGSAWQLDEASGEYYLHLFSRKQPDLNWENPSVRAAIYDMMRWWLDRGIDGFRMDVINLISKDPSLPDGEVSPGGLWGDGFPHYAAGPRIHEFLQEMHREVFEGRDRQYLTIGEMPGVTIEQARLFTDPERRELDMVFQFEHVGLDHGPEGKWSPAPVDIVALKRSLASWQVGLSDTGWNSLYWNNHDQPRVVSRFGDDDRYWFESATALATVLHLQRGTPFVYQGEELGMTNVPFAGIEQFRDIESLNYFAEAVDVLGMPREEVLAGMRRASRDNARTPVHWSDEPHGGFTTGSPWIDVHPDFARINAAAQRGRPGSVFEFYRRLIALRHSSAVVVDGEFGMLEPEHPALFAFTRTLGDERLVVAANLSSEPLAVPVTVPLGATVHAPHAAHTTTDGETVIANYPRGDRSVLRPWEALVVRTTEF